eukprot:2448973-Rhodomonas_salina.1
MVDEGQLISFVERSPTGNLFFSGEVGLFLLKLFEIAEDVVPIPAQNGEPERVSISGFFQGADEEQKGTFSYMCQEDAEADHSDGVHVKVIDGERDSLSAGEEPAVKSMHMQVVFRNGGEFAGSGTVGDAAIFMDGKYGPQGHAAARDAAACAERWPRAVAEIAATKDSFELGESVRFTFSGTGHDARNISSASLYDWVGIFPSTVEVSKGKCGGCWKWMRDQDASLSGADAISFEQNLPLPPG